MTDNEKYNFEANLMLFITANQEAYEQFQKNSGIEMEKEELIRRLEQAGPRSGLNTPLTL